MPRKNDTERDRERNRQYQRKWYAANRKTQQARVAANRQRYIAEVRSWIYELKKAGCSRCPENDPVCIDFHHLNPKEKEFTIARAISRRWSRKRIQEEIAKCILLCSNCHRKEHRNGGA